MGITLEKARNVLTKYREADFNAVQGLQNAGYTKSTSQKASKKILNGAIRKVATAELKAITTSVNPLHSLLGIVGITSEELINEYMFIVKQNKDLSTKLKAMLPLLAQHGITWNDDSVKVEAPVLNLTIRKDNTATDKGIIDVKGDNVAQ
jgi:hypothetical protein